MVLELGVFKVYMHREELSGAGHCKNGVSKDGGRQEDRGPAMSLEGNV